MLWIRNSGFSLKSPYFFYKNEIQKKALIFFRQLKILKYFLKLLNIKKRKNLKLRSWYLILIYSTQKVFVPTLGHKLHVLGFFFCCCLFCFVFCLFVVCWILFGFFWYLFLFVCLFFNISCCKPDILNLSCNSSPKPLCAVQLKKFRRDDWNQALLKHHLHPGYDFLHVSPLTQRCPILSHHDDKQDIELTCHLLCMSLSISQLYSICWEMSCP